MVATTLLFLAFRPTQQSALDGTWKGRVEIAQQNGSSEAATAILWLGHQNNGLLAALGAEPDKLTTLIGAKTTARGCSFDFPFHGSKIHFELSLAQGHLAGSGRSGPVELRLDLKPAPTEHPLFGVIAEQDARLFHAYDARDLAAMKGFFSRDLEFYHDKGGLQGFDQAMAGIQRGFVDPTRTVRVLDLDSMEVYPIKGFGAVQTGVHRFYSVTGDGERQLTATAKFVHIWKNEHGHWVITREISYDHE